ncbi:MAG: energy transducer TonB [Pirellulales bacterium]|nr:energy transducer TonB [Pirellulales bacterium]
MSLYFNNLTRLAASHDSFAWGASLAVHLVGAMVAWSTLASQVWDTAPELPGQKTRVQLSANWSPPTANEEQDEPSVDVVVTPSRVRIDHRVYHKASADVSRPNPTLRPIESITGKLPTMASHQRSMLAEESEPQIHVPPKPIIKRNSHPSRVPTVEIPMPASLPVNPSVAIGKYSQPTLLENRPPDYPPQAVVDRLQGVVLLRIHIAETGSVESAEIIQSTGHAVLDAAAVRAVTAWRFTPARRNGQPAPAMVRLPVRFSLE